MLIDASAASWDSSIGLSWMSMSVINKSRQLACGHLQSVQLWRRDGDHAGLTEGIGGFFDGRSVSEDGSDNGGAVF
jgi:hypothetical protein